MQTSTDPLRSTETGLLARHEPRPSARRFADVVSWLTRGGALWCASSFLLRSSRDERARRAANNGLVAWVASEAVTFAVKRVVQRPRPPLRGAGPIPRSTSMPSSHTASAVAYTIAVGTQLPVAALPLGAVAAAVAWSRLATDRHFPSDVFVGALIGAAVGGTIATTAGLQPRFKHSPSERAASRRSEHCPRS